MCIRDSLRLGTRIHMPGLDRLKVLADTYHPVGVMANEVGVYQRLGHPRRVGLGCSGCEEHGPAYTLPLFRLKGHHRQTSRQFRGAQRALWDRGAGPEMLSSTASVEFGTVERACQG